MERHRLQEFFALNTLNSRTATRVIDGQTLVTGVAVAFLELDSTAGTGDH